MAGVGYQKSSGGRPTERDEPKRSAIAVRTTPTTKQRLEDAAGVSGRSLTQEIEQRLERSLELEDDLGGSDGISMFRAVALAMKSTREQVGDWRTDFDAFVVMRASLLRVIDGFQPIPTTFAETMANISSAIDRGAPREEIAAICEDLMQEVNAHRGRRARADKIAQVALDGVNGITEQERKTADTGIDFVDRILRIDGILRDS